MSEKFLSIEYPMGGTRASQSIWKNCDLTCRQGGATLQDKGAFNLRGAPHAGHAKNHHHHHHHNDYVHHHDFYDGHHHYHERPQ